jgi:hypothetical protein
MAAVSRLPRAASRSPALPAAGKDPQRRDRPAGQCERWGQRQHRIDAGGAVRPGRCDGVAAKLPSGQHGERQHRDVGPGPADPGDDRRPAPPDPRGTRGGRQADGRHQDDGGAGRHHGRRPPPPGQRVGCPGGDPPGQPDSGRRAARPGQQAERECFRHRHPDQLQAAGAPGGQHRILALALRREQLRDHDQGRAGEQEQFDGGDGQQ